MRKRLDEIADVTKLAGFEFTKYMKYIDNGEIIAIRALNLKAGRLVLDDVKRIAKDVSEKLERSQLHKYDIVLSYTGTIGETAQIMEEGKYHLAPNVAKVVPKCDVINPEYLFQYIRSREFKQQMINYAHGSTQPTIPMATIRELTVPVYDIKTEERIASILSSLDKKIEINNEINDNLLQQVTACFHHHFDAYEASTDAIGSLGDMAQFKYGTMPKKDKLGSGEYVAFSGYQVVGSYPEKMFSTPQLIVVARGVGGCGDIKYTPSNCYLTNLSIAILTQNTAIEDYLFNYLRLHDTTVMNTGSAQPQITVSTLEKYQLPIPPEYLLASFSTFVQPFKTLYRKNKAEIERLQVLRDTLLPRLMSGELDVSNIDI